MATVSSKGPQADANSDRKWAAVEQRSPEALSYEHRSTTMQKYSDGRMRDAGFVMETNDAGRSYWFRPFPVTPYGGTK